MSEPVLVEAALPDTALIEAASPEATPVEEEESSLNEPTIEEIAAIPETLDVSIDEENPDATIEHVIEQLKGMGLNSEYFTITSDDVSPLRFTYRDERTTLYIEGGISHVSNDDYITYTLNFPGTPITITNAQLSGKTYITGPANVGPNNFMVKVMNNSGSYIYNDSIYTFWISVYPSEYSDPTGLMIEGDTSHVSNDDYIYYDLNFPSTPVTLTNALYGEPYITGSANVGPDSFMLKVMKHNGSVITNDNIYVFWLAFYPKEYQNPSTGLVIENDINHVSNDDYLYYDMDFPSTPVTITNAQYSSQPFITAASNVGSNSFMLKVMNHSNGYVTNDNIFSFWVSIYPLAYIGSSGTPPGNVTNFNAVAYTDYCINVSWTKGSGSDRTVVRARTDTYPTSPTDGTAVYNGTDVRYTKCGLTPGTKYWFGAWALNTSSGLYSTGSARDTEYTLPSPVTNVIFEFPTSTRIAFYWQEGLGSDRTVIRRRDSVPPSSYSDGYLLYNGTGDGVEDTGLTPGVHYYYRLWAVTTASGYHALTPYAADVYTLPAGPTSLRAFAPTYSTINLTWVKGAGANATRIQRAVGSYPSTYSSGTTVYFGSGTKVQDTGLSEGTSYYYRAWSYSNASQDYSDDYSQSYNTTTSHPPNITLTPTQYWYGNVSIEGCSPNVTFTLTNVGGGTAQGNVNLTWYEPYGGQYFHIRAGGGAFALGPGATQTIKVQFCPGGLYGPGLHKANLTAWGSNCNTARSNLTGTGVVPNDPPVLSNGNVNPVEGYPLGHQNWVTTFNLTVTYSDDEGDAPTTRSVFIDNVPYTMNLVSGDYHTGVFRYSTSLLSDIPKNHSYYFVFNDGYNGDVRLPTSGSYLGPYVLSNHTLFGRDYAYHEGDVINYGTHSIRMSQGIFDGGMVTYRLNISNAVSQLKAGIFFYDVSSLGDGPDISMYNYQYYDWDTIATHVGTWDTPTWYWVTIPNPIEYINYDDTVYLRIDADYNDDTILEVAGINYTPSPPPNLDVNPTSRNFGNVSIGNCSPGFPFNVTNVGTATAYGSAMLEGTSFNFSNTSEYSIPFVLNTSQSVLIYVKFCPATAGPKTGYLHLYCTHCYEYDTNASLSGFGLGPNQAPSLTKGNVTPRTGDTGMTYTFRVTYTDADGDAPSPGQLRLLDARLNMTYEAGSIPTGAVYKYVTSLGPGNWYFYYNFSDGHGHYARYPASGVIEAPNVTNVPPVAEAGGPYVGYVGQTITFDASGSYDPDGTLLWYRWDWTNDGSWDTTWLTTATTTHTYSSAFNGTARLQVKDNYEAYANDTAPVTIYPNLADLSVTELLIPEYIVDGDVYLVRARIDNLGEQPANNFRVRFYQWAPNGTEWTTLDTQTKSLNPGQYLYAQVWWVPSGPGTYGLKVFADYDNSIPEINENNNERTGLADVLATVNVMASAHYIRSTQSVNFDTIIHDNLHNQDLTTGLVYFKLFDYQGAWIPGYGGTSDPFVYNTNTSRWENYGNDVSQLDIGRWYSVIVYYGVDAGSTQFLKESGFTNITGHVYDQYGGSIPNANIKVYYPPVNFFLRRPANYEVNTTGTGSYALLLIPAHPYLMVARNGTLIPDLNFVFATSDANHVVDFRVKKDNAGRYHYLLAPINQSTFELYDRMNDEIVDMNHKAQAVMTVDINDTLWDLADIIGSVMVLSEAGATLSGVLHTTSESFREVFMTSLKQSLAREIPKELRGELIKEAIKIDAKALMTVLSYNTIGKIELTTSPFYRNLTNYTDFVYGSYLTEASEDPDPLFDYDRAEAIVKYTEYQFDSADTSGHIILPYNFSNPRDLLFASTSDGYDVISVAYDAVDYGQKGWTLAKIGIGIGAIGLILTGYGAPAGAALLLTVAADTVASPALEIGQMTAGAMLVSAYGINIGTWANDMQIIPGIFDDVVTFFLREGEAPYYMDHNRRFNATIVEFTFRPDTVIHGQNVMCVPGTGGEATYPTTIRIKNPTAFTTSVFVRINDDWKYNLSLGPNQTWKVDGDNYHWEVPPNTRMYETYHFKVEVFAGLPVFSYDQRDMTYQAIPGCYPGRGPITGDTVVPYSSSRGRMTLRDVGSYFPYEVTLKNATLSAANHTVDVNYTVNANASTVAFSFSSPQISILTFYVNDSQGRRLGYDFDEERVLTQYPGSYNGKGKMPQLVTIPDATNRTYRIHADIAMEFLGNETHQVVIKAYETGQRPAILGVNPPELEGYGSPGDNVTLMLAFNEAGMWESLFNVTVLTGTMTSGSSVLENLTSTNMSIGTILPGTGTAVALTYTTLPGGPGIGDYSGEANISSANAGSLAVPIVIHIRERPNQPTLTGPEGGIIGMPATFVASATDPGGYDLYYKFYWGDGTPTDWIGPFPSGQPCNASHSWATNGSYDVIVRAKNEWHQLSPRSDPWTIGIGVDVIGPEWRNLGQEHSFILPGESNMLYAEARDNVALDWAILATNETGTWQNFTTEEEPPSNASNESWWNGNWSYRKSIVIDHTKVAADQVDFPVFIETLSADFLGRAQSDGDDFVFILNTTRLNHELELFNSTSGRLAAWVRIPFLSASQDTELYVYYGNNATPSQQNATGVWNNDYAAVWHLNTDPAGRVFDSTLKNNGTSYGGMTSALNLIDAKAGKGYDFDGSNDYVLAPDSASLKPSEVSIISWVRPKRLNESGNWHYGKGCRDIWNNYDAVSYGVYFYQFNFTTRYELDNNSYIYVRHQVPGVDAWYHVASTYDQVTRNLSLFVDGVPRASGFHPQDLRYYGSWDFMMAANHAGAGSGINRWVNTSLDEMWILNRNVSAGYIATLYANQDDPSGFVTIGPQEEPEQPQPWWNSSWAYRKEVVVDQGIASEDQLDFPLFVQFTSTDLVGHAQPDGDDFVFVLNGTKLNHELDAFNATAGKLSAWVRIPRLVASNDTLLYIYYGNPSASSQQNATGVWNSDYAAVWHLNTDPAGRVFDSTLKNNGTSYGGMTSALNLIDAKAGKGYDFDGSNDHVLAPDSVSLRPSEVSIISWVKPKRLNESGNWHYGKGCKDIWNNYDAVSYGVYFYQYNFTTRYELDNNSYIYVRHQVPGVDAWYHVASTYDQVTRNLSLFIDGVPRASGFHPQDLRYSGSWEFMMAANHAGAGSGINRWVNTSLDEMWILNRNVSAAYLAALYNNQNDPSLYVHAGQEEAQGRGGGRDAQYGSPMYLNGTADWVWTNFTWQNPSIPLGTTVGWRIYYVDNGGLVSPTDVMTFRIGNATPVDPERSFVTLTNSNWPGMTTCPIRDGPAYQYVQVTALDAQGLPVPGVPAARFTFATDVMPGTQYVEPLTCDFIAVDQETNASGQIRFNATCGSVVGNLTIQGFVDGQQINDLDVLPVKSMDLTVDGQISLTDFSMFAQDYTTTQWRSDFTWDGIVGLTDFSMFAQHYTHGIIPGREDSGSYDAVNNCLRVECKGCRPELVCGK
ncbi:MAG: DUF2341 domain-containing protein [Nanoarchaeota archaeon]